ncbi:hypothetical protein KO481_02265 [Nocardia sp. NEAU-G5]|uniref:Uncharacterized protein n=1 Tax=Nocardia albiluteola TaxID=2842303 RepID=A0ABS6ARX5_9NOCA|nr:hypothetical protein [Nocardia albiluteola]MBU3060345.1 hypothetical protein [Nocardia albiluteola]
MDRDSQHDWVPTEDPEMVELRDPLSRWGVRIVRPDSTELPGEFLVELEALVFEWEDTATQAGADAYLALRGVQEQQSILRGLSWLCALWAVVCEARLGKPADSIIRDLDYRGGRRTIHTAQEAERWEGMTRRVRLGALAALTEDPRAVAAYRVACTDPADIARALIEHTLVHLDGFSQDMQRHNLTARGLAAAVISHTSPGDGPRRRLCFRPAHPI